MRSRAKWAPAQTIDGKGRIVMPGLVNVHNHTPLMITRGMIEDIGFAPMYTPGIPQGHWLNEDDAYALSSLGIYELLRAGCTTVMDFYRYPSSCARAAAELGVRAVIAGRVHDAEPASLADGKHELQHGDRPGEPQGECRAYRALERARHGRIRCDWAPHAPDTCSDDLLREVKKLADAHGGNVHTHLSQLPAEIEAVKARTGLTPPQLMDKLGLLNDKLIAAHCIHMDRADIELCGKAQNDRGARADRQCQRRPDRADHGASGGRRPHRALHRHLLRRPDRGDALGDLHAAHQPPGQCARPEDRAGLGHARGRGRRSGMADQVGSLEIGKKADIVLLDSRAPTLAPMIDGYGVLVHSASGHDVDTVIVDGRVVLSGGRLTLADGDAIVAKAQKVASALWQRAGRQPIG